MSKFINFETVTGDLNFVALDSIYLVTTNEIYYTYGTKIESEIITDIAFIRIADQIIFADEGWINIRNFVNDENVVGQTLVRKDSITGIIKTKNGYELKLEYNGLPVEVEVAYMTENEAAKLAKKLAE